MTIKSLSFASTLSLCLFYAGITFCSCKKDKTITSSNAKLNFSADSVLFDTVFTTIGSTTKIFMIYNPYKESIIISKAYIATGISSQFRINIDGSSGPSLQNIELLPQDSMFVFVQVTVNPTGVNSPLLIKDSIIFETNGNSQHILLTAIGQDVYLHKPTIFPTNGAPAYSYINCATAWTNDKPHLIFGYAVVNTNDVLTMNAGTKVYLNKDAVLEVYKGGSLIINGAKGTEVTFQGARLESDYANIAGQWGKIWLTPGSINNSINWAIIKNGSIGIEADSITLSGSPLLTLTNTIIKNIAAAALYGVGSHIRSYNSVFANCGQYVATLANGGNYTFQQCTFANYWSQSIRNTSLLYINNYYTSGNSTVTGSLDSAYFGNCILYGTLSDEINLDPSTSGGTFNYKFENCLVKTTINMSNDGVHYNNIIVNDDPIFSDTDKGYYELKSSSPAIDKGYNTIINYDLNNKPRPNPTTSIPDLGAYEYY
jgi:hypothetical protein